MEFLWVRWFEPIDALPVQDGWDAHLLDHLRFPAMGHPDAFGFVNPDHVLRAFHAIPRFSTGPRHPDGRGCLSVHGMQRIGTCTSLIGEIASKL